MESFFYRYRNPLVLLGLVLLQVLLLASQVRRILPGTRDNAEVRLLRVWEMEAISPFERAFLAVGRTVRNTWNGYFWLRSVRSQNQELKSEVMQLRLEQASLAEDARQGQRLQAMLRFKEHYPAALVAAQVIGTSGSENSRVLYLDKGSDDGLAPDMPVITPDGIVGKLREISPHSSQVLEISDQTSGAGIMLATTRIRGVLRGNALGQPEVINMLPDERIQTGELVLTSGGDQVYPRGLTVGTVEKVVPDPERDPYVAILVKPAANLAKLEEVMIITTQGDAQPVSTAKDLKDSEATAEQQKAAEVLADKLPTVAITAEAITAEAESAKALPVPVAPIHPDRFTPAEVKPASAMQPGVSPAPAEGIVGMKTKPAAAPASGAATTGPGTAASANPAAPPAKPVTYTHANDDGTTTTTTKYPDGSRLLVRKDADGNVVSTRKVPAPDPAAVAAAAANPTAPVTTTHKNDDGTTAVITRYPDGSRLLVRKDADGNVISTRKEAAPAPGTAPAAPMTTTHTNDDGTITTATRNPDGSRLLVRKDANGNVISTRKVPAPDAAATGGTAAGGTAAGAAKPVDNSPVHWTNDDGTTTVVTKNPDGSKTIVRKKDDGTIVSTRHVVPATPGVPGAAGTATAGSTAAKPATAPAAGKPATPGTAAPKPGTAAPKTGTATPRAAGTPAADGTTTSILRNADGSRTVIKKAADGSVISVRTIPAPAPGTSPSTSTPQTAKPAARPAASTTGTAPPAKPKKNPAVPSADLGAVGDQR